MTAAAGAAPELLRQPGGLGFRRVRLLGGGRHGGRGLFDFDGRLGPAILGRGHGGPRLFRALRGPLLRGGGGGLVFVVGGGLPLGLGVGNGGLGAFDRGLLLVAFRLRAVGRRPVAFEP